MVIVIENEMNKYLMTRDLPKISSSQQCIDACADYQSDESIYSNPYVTNTQYGGNLQTTIEGK